MRILLYTGKGGVGKTTVAAATAVKLAAQAGDILDHLRSLEAAGVKVLLNRSSLTHHSLEREIRQQHLQALAPFRQRLVGGRK